jgi:hypothetical protein
MTKFRLRKGEIMVATMTEAPTKDWDSLAAMDGGQANKKSTYFLIIQGRGFQLILKTEGGSQDKRVFGETFLHTI